MKKLIPVVVVVALCAIGGFVFINFGFFDIAANRPHSKLTLWFINKTVTQSVKRRARGINPPDLSNPLIVRSGGYRFQQMCVQCHGGPGVERSDAGEGLYPEGPDLAHAKRRWAPQELFWITKNGLKMTGMPAWAHASTDEEIWSMVAFMEQMPAISPEKYQQMLNEAETKSSSEQKPNEP
jgi:mono/diheme cytochrome c family protein